MNISPTVLRILLIVSLALNVFVGSTAVSSWWRHGHVCLGPEMAQHRWRPSHMPGPGELRRILPQSDQPVLDEVLAAHREQIRQRIRALRQSRKDVSLALSAEPFDRPRLDAAFAAVRENETVLAVAAQSMMADLAARISPEGRSRLAQQLQSHGSRGKHSDNDDAGSSGSRPGDRLER